MGASKSHYNTVYSTKLRELHFFLSSLEGGRGPAVVCYVSGSHIRWKVRVQNGSVPILQGRHSLLAFSRQNLFVLQLLPPCVNAPRFVLVAFGHQDSTNDLPYNFGPSNSWDVNSSYLSPYDWLYGEYAPPFWADNFEALALSEVRLIQPGAISGANRPHISNRYFFPVFGRNLAHFGGCF